MYWVFYTAEKETVLISFGNFITHYEGMVMTRPTLTFFFQNNWILKPCNAPNTDIYQPRKPEE